VFIDYLTAQGHDNGRLLIPGSIAELRRSEQSLDRSAHRTECTIQHPVPDDVVMGIFTEKKAYLETYASRQQAHLAEARSSWARYDGDIAEAIADWFDPLLALADHISSGVGERVLLRIGDEDLVVDFPRRQVRRHSGEECRYEFFLERRFVEALIAEHQIDWVNSLFLSLRFRARRRGPYNEHIFTFFKSLSPERLSYAEGCYAEEEPEELIRLGDYTVQRRCPHLKADLARFGEVQDSILQCCMHGWRFDLATGRCLTSPTIRILSFPIAEGVDPASGGYPSGADQAGSSTA
jgi:UDP-MurNAc hydroxylase